VLDAHERLGQSIVGLKVTPGAEVVHFGCVGGIWQTENSTLTITEFAEKPSLDYAQKHLVVDGIEEGRFLTVFGQYVLKPRIFEILEENIRNNVRERGEFQLTSCLDRMRQEDGFMGIVVQGRRFDIGLPEAYRETVIDFRNA
jgi:UTP--glucose-1-phosphate uridylyltransferase